MTGVIVGAVLGALLIGVPSARWARLQRAKSDWDGAAKLHRNARAGFWRALGAFTRAAIGPAAALLVVYALYRIGQQR